MILNEYETIYVARPDLTEDVMTKITTRFEAVITNNAGVILVSEDWGKRKLAYIISKHQRGHYIYLNYVAPAKLVAEVERTLGLEDQLLRFLTVKLEENVEIEARRALAEERKRLRIERMAALKAEEEAEARYRAEAEEAEDELAVEADA
ncbi:MAG: 30S ribosomal protein S6 [Pseudomonadota bacterium]|nr:30S ribosomal protein S6 [Pseudomonadota bacterium]